MREQLKTIIKELSFNPGVWGIFINPFYIARKGLHHHIVSLAPSLNGKILDVGCGTKPYETYFKNATEYIGLEIEGKNNKKADHYYNGIVFPFKDREFDSIFSSQVLEHVFNPTFFLSEINRVLKDDGVLLLTVPFIWDEHEQPFDYARYSSYGLRYLIERHGFEVIEQLKSTDDIRVIFQLINAYIYKITSSKKNKLYLLFAIPIMGICNVLGEIITMILPQNGDLYLDNILLARKIRTVRKNLCTE